MGICNIRGVSMYGFKIFVTTLICLMLAVLFYVMHKSNQNGRYAAYAFILVDLLSLIAIWG